MGDTEPTRIVERDESGEREWRKDQDSFDIGGDAKGAEYVRGLKMYGKIDEAFIKDGVRLFRLAKSLVADLKADDPEEASYKLTRAAGDTNALPKM